MHILLKTSSYLQGVSVFSDGSFKEFQDNATRNSIALLIKEVDVSVTLETIRKTNKQK